MIVSDLNSQRVIWQVFDRLRDEIPPDEICVALAALIYLRWADFQEAEHEAISAFEDTEHKPVLPSSMHWRTWHLLPPKELQHFFANRLPKALAQHNNSRHISIATHLHRIGPTVEKMGRLSSELLSELVSWLAEMPFETSHDRRALLDIFDSVLARILDKRISGEYLTPPSLAKLLAELAAPSPGDRIYDPCFGSAGFLTALLDFVVRKSKNEFVRPGSSSLSVFGVEMNVSAYILGLVRLTLSGIEDPQLEIGNSLERVPTGNPLRDGFDLILSNPPWGVRIPTAGLDHLVVRTNDVTANIIQHALSCLNRNGRALIVVPPSLLSRRGPEQRLRRMLLEQHFVEAVISLPAELFLPSSSIAASLMILRRTGPTKHIRMMNAESFFDPKILGKAGAIQQSKIEELAQELRNPKPGEHSWDVEADSFSELEWDFTPKRRNRSTLLTFLDNLQSRVEVLPLRECCEVLSGRHFPQNQLMSEPPTRPDLQPEQQSIFPEENLIQQQMLFNFEVIPFVRIKDVQRGQATSGSSWLSQDAVAAVDSKWKLRAGDVLLSKSGTIGKCGLVRNGAVGGVPSSGLFLLRPDKNRLDPRFLLSYLDSSDCRAWLDDKAPGATIRHLSKAALEEMPVPLPPLQVQHRVASEHREQGLDSLLFLKKVVFESENDPIIEWIEDAFRYFTIPTSNEIYPLINSRVFGQSFTRLRNIVAHDYEKNPLNSWILELSQVADLLRNLDTIPPGPACFSLLQQASISLNKAETLISDALNNQVKARMLTQALKARVSSVMTALASDIRVVVSSEIYKLPIDARSEIQMTVKNESKLPLRDFRIHTTPEWGEIEIAYFPEGGSRIVSLVGFAPKAEGNFSIRVGWTALGLDGRDVEGQLELSFDLVESSSAENVKLPYFGGSPYVCGDPVRPERKDVFFGREELLDQISRQIIQSGNVVLLEGNRRSGKSSILSQLEGINTIPGWLTVYCSLQGAEGSSRDRGVPTVEVYRALAYSIARALQKLGEDTLLPGGRLLPRGKRLGISEACHKAIREESSFSDFREYLETVLEMLGKRNLKLLLMLDEFDKLQEGIDSGITSPQVPENIRYLVQTYPHFSAILTGSRRLKRLREEYWSALFGLGTRFGVTSLSRDAARLLINEPVKGRLTYSGEATNRAIYLTAGQPYLLQCLCNRVFDMASQLKTGSVTLDLVDRASDSLVKDNEHFASLWDYASTDRRRFILALCQKDSAGPDPLRFGVVQERLISYGIEISDTTLISDLEFLRELELVELIKDAAGGYYALSIPLMGTWIERQQDFAILLSKARQETEDQQ
jgi:type I restriction enzyme M protein